VANGLTTMQEIERVLGPQRLVPLQEPAKS